MPIESCTCEWRWVPGSLNDEVPCEAGRAGQYEDWSASADFPGGLTPWIERGPLMKLT